MGTRLLQRVISPLILLFCIAAPFLLQAQSKNPNDQLAKQQKKADQLYSAYKLVEASKVYQEILALDPANFHSAYMMADISTRMEDHREAVRWYKDAININPDANDTAYLKQGIAYKRIGNYMKAKESFLMFQRKHENKEDEYFNRATREIKGCDYAEEQLALNQKPMYRVDTVSFNSASVDMYPSLLDQRQEDKYLVFTSHRRPEGKASTKNEYGGIGDGYSDLFMVVIENDSTFSAPVNMGAPINTPFNDGNSTFTSDGLTAYYSSPVKTGKGGAEQSLFESKYDFARKQWGKPMDLKGINGKQLTVINSKGKTKELPSWDAQPSISGDGMTMVFASNRDGGQGGKDIWMTKRSGSAWTAPVNLGSKVNTPFHETSPFLNEDGTKLFFASEGHVGFGGFDIYMSTMDGNGEFGEPQNMGAPINSSFNDYASVFTNNDSTVYFTSDRTGGKGRSDIYWGKYNVYPFPHYEVSIQGMIVDKSNKQPVPFAIATLYELQEDGTLTEVTKYETDNSARYNFPLEPNKNYKILANSREYLANEISVSTNGLFPAPIRGGESMTKRLERNIDIELEPIEIINAPIVLQNIYYDYDKYYIREDAEKELDKLVTILKKNPHITIQLGSHTDTNGSEDYNKTLSENRAQACVKYLIDHGVAADRLTWFGFGESMPVYAPEKNDFEEQTNRRTEFRITSLDYKGTVTPPMNMPIPPTPMPAPKK